MKFTAFCLLLVPLQSHGNFKQLETFSALVALSLHLAIAIVVVLSLLTFIFGLHPLVRDVLVVSRKKIQLKTLNELRRMLFASRMLSR